MDVHQTTKIDIGIGNKMVVGLRLDLPDEFRQFGLGALKSHPGFALLGGGLSTAQHQDQQTEWHEQLFDLKNQIIIHTFVLKFISRFHFDYWTFFRSDPPM